MRTGIANCWIWGRFTLAALILNGLTCAARAEPFNVVVTVKPVHALVAGVMAGMGEPQLLVQGAASPHTFALKPSVARLIESADVFVRVSEATEPFTHKVIEGLPKSVTVITLASSEYGVALLDQRTGGVFETHEHEGADHHHDAASGVKDGHIWLDPDNAKAIVRAVSERLAAKAPAHAQLLKSNAMALEARIDALDKEIGAELAPVKGKPFIVFHDAYQYFEKHFGLSASGAISVSPEQQASAKRLSEIRQRIKETGALCVFAEPGFKPSLVEAVREGTTAGAATLDPEGLLIEPGPELYFTLLRNLASSLKACLGG